MAKKRVSKILVCDPLGAEGLEVFRSRGYKVVSPIHKSLADLKRLVRDVEGVVVRSGTHITAEVIKEARKLRIIGRAGVGLDNVDVKAASKHGVVVVNTPSGNTISAAEHTVALMLALSRNVANAHATLASGKWDRKRFMGVELFEKTLGLVGLGRIGAEVAKRAQSFGMQVMAYDPFLRADHAQKLGVHQVTLDHLFQHADFISLHVPLTNETRNIIDERAFKRMKKGVRIINCARGGLIHETALVKAIDDGKVAGAGLDVFETEPPGKTHLTSNPNVVLTPHLGASTEEAQKKVAIDIARTMCDYLDDKGIRNAVNMPSLDSEVLKKIQPYLTLAEKLGRMHAELLKGQLMQVSIRYEGDAAMGPTVPLTVAVVKGLLEPIMPGSVNHVNACLVAKERGIKITELKTEEPGNFSNLIHVSLKTNKGKCVLAGTVYAPNDIRIVMIDGVHIDLKAKGGILYILNKDVPGMVGKIGTVLGKHRINISDMTLGREGRDRARTLISVDQLLSKRVLKSVRSLKNILDARFIQL